MLYNNKNAMLILCLQKNLCKYTYVMQPKKKEKYDTKDHPTRVSTLLVGVVDEDQKIATTLLCCSRRRRARMDARDSAHVGDAVYAGDAGHTEDASAVVEVRKEAVASNTEQADANRGAGDTHRDAGGARKDAKDARNAGRAGWGARRREARDARRDAGDAGDAGDATAGDAAKNTRVRQVNAQKGARKARGGAAKNTRDAGDARKDIIDAGDAGGDVGIPKEGQQGSTEVIVKKKRRYACTRKHERDFVLIFSFFIYFIFINHCVIGSPLIISLIRNTTMNIFKVGLHYLLSTPLERYFFNFIFY